MVYLLNRYTNNNVIQQSTTLRHSFIWVSVLFHYLCITEQAVKTVSTLKFRHSGIRYCVNACFIISLQFWWYRKVYPRISTAGIRYGCLFCFSRIKNVYLNCSDDNPSVNKNLFHLTPPAVKYEAYIIRKTHFLNLPNLVLENKKCIFALLRFQSMLYLSVAGARHLSLYI